MKLLFIWSSRLIVGILKIAFIIMLLPGIAMLFVPCLILAILEEAGNKLDILEYGKEEEEEEEED